MTKISSTRLGYTGNLDPVIERLCEAYGIGESVHFSIIAVGYEDCNVTIETQSGKYVAKIFSKERNKETISRYVEIMTKVLDAGVNHPPLIRTGEGKVIYCDDQADGISMVLMDFIGGETFFELDRAPDNAELKLIIEQAAKINGIDYHPIFLFDGWAIPNIEVMFDKVKNFIEPADLRLVEQAISKYKEIPADILPHALVHGDFTKANILKGIDGKMYILDFSVSNWYPRIQELAVISANLLHSETDSGSLREKTDLVITEYDKITPLTKDEKKYLYPYALAGSAMEFMGACSEKFIKGNSSEETDYWLNLGRNGLKREFTTG
ncbi:MAG TPA: phosphotransferase [bacterium]|nr:phosphotransferase [bacterium]HNZ51662.1 phosphotransferase [bacterium]HOH85683.1 phosphotransferase [bacterium]